MRKDTTWPTRKSHRAIVNQRRQYSRVCAGNASVSTRKSSFVEANGSNAAAVPAASSCSRIPPMPTFLAFPHSDACNETSTPVGSSPSSAMIVSHDPCGVSKTKNRPMADSGAGSTTYTPTVDRNSIPAKIFVSVSNTAYLPMRMMATEAIPMSSP